MNEELRRAVREVIALLVARRYAELEARTKGVRLSAREMEGAIGEYGRQLVEPPEEAMKLMSAIEVENARPRRWSVVMPLWTRQEGRSDLSIELTIVESEPAPTIELDDIHVL